MSYPSKTEFDNLRNSLPLTYQTRGNYAFRTDLASNINTALRNVNTALAAYAKKTDIPIVPANVATKTDLAGYALASDLSKYQPAGRYVSPSELEAYQAKGDYALAKDLVSYAKSSDLANFQPKGEYALAADLASYAKESSLASYQPKGDYAVKSDLANFQPKGEYALAADLASYARQSSLASYQPKGDYALAKDLESYAVKTDLAGYQPKGNYQTAGNYALQTDLDGYQPKGSYALQTDLAGYQPKGNYQTAGNYALKTELANYALTKDFANLQPKGNYQTAGNYALQPTAGNYALQSELAGYVKTAGASTFSGQATFDKNAIVKTEGTTPFQVLGPGGLRVSGGNLTVTGALATFENNATVTTSAGKPFEVKGAGGIDVDGIGIAAAGTITGKGRLHITGPELLYVLNKDGLMIGKEWKGSGNLGVQGDTTISGNASIAGSLSGNSLFLESGLDPALRLGPGIKDTVDANARLNVQDKAGSYMRFFSGATETGSITQDSGTSLNVTKVNAGQVSTGNAFITNATIGNFNMTGAPTFSALATFKSNATIETTADKPFQVTGPGGLTVAGNKLKLGNATFHSHPTDGWVRMSADDGNTFNYGLASKNVFLDENLTINNKGSVAHIQTPNSQLKMNQYGVQFGGPNNKKQLDSAQISVGLHAADTLSIVGMSDATGQNRKIDAYAEGGFNIYGTANVSKLSATTGSITNLSATTGSITNLSATTGSITNLTVGNFNLTGAPTFSGLATLKGNATVTTTDSKPFEVTGPGGLKIAAGGLVVGAGGATVSGNLNVDGSIGINPSDAFIYGDNKLSHYGLKWANETGTKFGPTAFLSSYGGIKMFTQSAERLSIDADGNATFGGGATIKGASTFKAQSTFENNATVATTANNPFKVTGAGGLQVDHTKLKLGNATFDAHPTDTWVRMSADNGTSYNYGLAAKNLWTNGDLSVGGSLSANHMFLESGADPALRLGPNIKDIGNARLNVQDKAGTYMRFFQGANETGSITHDGGTTLSVNKAVVNSARFNTTGATTFFPGHTLALDSSGVVGGSFIVKSDAVKGNTKVGINNENPTSSLDVVGSAKIGNTSGSGITIDPATITGSGRLHISGTELLYILNKNGLVIGKEWGGNGNIDVQGDSIVKGNSTVNGSLKIGNWLLYQHSNGNLHFRNTAKDDGTKDYDDWDFVLDGTTRKKLYTNTIDTSDTNDLILQNRNRDDTKDNPKVTQFKLGGNGVIYQDFHQWGNKKNNWIGWNG